MGEGLNYKQALFVKEYLVDLNATQAAIRAGYSAKTANEQAARMLAKVSIKEAVQEAMQNRAKKVEITAEDVLQSIVDIRSKTIEAERYSEALKANELLGKHLKLFTERIEHDVTESLATTIMMARKRVKTSE